MSTTSPSLQQAVHTRLSPRCPHSNVGIGNIDPPHPARRILRGGRQSTSPLCLKTQHCKRDYDGVLALDAKFHEYLRQLPEFFQLDPTSIQQTQEICQEKKRKNPISPGSASSCISAPTHASAGSTGASIWTVVQRARLFPPGLSVYAPPAPRCSTCEDKWTTPGPWSASNPRSLWSVM